MPQNPTPEVLVEKGAKTTRRTRASKLAASEMPLVLLHMKVAFTGLEEKLDQQLKLLGVDVDGLMDRCRARDAQVQGQGHPGNQLGNDTDSVMSDGGAATVGEPSSKPVRRGAKRKADIGSGDEGDGDVGTALLKEYPYPNGVPKGVLGFLRVIPAEKAEKAKEAKEAAGEAEKTPRKRVAKKLVLSPYVKGNVTFFIQTKRMALLTDVSDKLLSIAELVIDMDSITAGKLNELRKVFGFAHEEDGEGTVRFTDGKNMVALSQLDGLLYSSLASFTEMKSLFIPTHIEKVDGARIPVPDARRKLFSFKNIAAAYKESFMSVE